MNILRGIKYRSIALKNSIFFIFQFRSILVYEFTNLPLEEDETTEILFINDPESC
jgi:hypothetical protein